MSKNRLSWIFAMVSAAVLSLPIAHAQSFTGTRWVYILINAAVIGVALFILQAFLVPNKGDKEKTSMWGIVLLISLLVAFLYGQNGFIWRTGPLSAIFNIYLIVNAAIIAAALYFTLGLIPKFDMKSFEGKTGFGLLLFIISAVIAYNLSPNQWIWSQDTIRGIVGYLFSGESVPGRPGLARGVLHYKGGLMVLISSFLLISFFFNKWLLKDKEGLLNYALALLFAFNMATPPASPMRFVVYLGEFFFVLILWDSLKNSLKGKEDHNFLALLLAIFLVGWASTALTVNTPDARGFLGSIGCYIASCKEMAAGAAGSGILGWLAKAGLWGIGLVALGIVVWMMVYKRSGKTGKKYMGWGLVIGLLLLLLLLSGVLGWSVLGIIGLVILLPLALVGGGIFVISRSEKKGKFKDIKDRYIRLFRNLGWRKANEVAAQAGFNRYAWTKRRIIPDRLPEIMKENIVILFSLNNYLKRLYIWNVKFDQVKNAAAVCETMEVWINIHDNYDKLIDDIYECRNGVIVDLKEEPDQSPDAEYTCRFCGQTFNGRGSNLRLEEHINDSHKPKEEKLGVGWFDATRKYCETLNEISVFLQKYVAAIVGGMKIDDKEYPNFIATAQRLKVKLDRIVENIEQSRRYLKERREAFGNYQPLKIQRYLVLDQCNPCGFHEHYYSVAPKGTLLTNGKRTKREMEVNLYGEILEDKYKNQDRFYDLQKAPIRVHQTEVKKIQHIWPSGKGNEPHHVMEAIGNDWLGFIRNMRYGYFRPNSKKAMDYIKRLSTKPEDTDRLGNWLFFEEQEITSEFKFASEKDPGFDRRALVDTGILTYVGRKNLHDSWKAVSNNKKTDPLPGVSSYGMSLYLPRLIFRDTEDIAAINEVLNRFIADTGATVEGKAQAHLAGGVMKAQESEGGAKHQDGHG